MDSITSITAQALSKKRHIGPRTHAIIDYSTAATFFGLAYRFRHHRRASMAALCSGLSVLTLSLFTDYPGGVFRKVSFVTHGKVDAMQAAFTAGAPVIFGFSGDPEARAFYAQAGMEAAVVARTDWQTSTGRSATPDMSEWEPAGV